MNSLEEKYKILCNTPSDIWEHLPTLKKYAEECDYITELGVRGGNSTIALLMGNPIKMISYDIVNCSIEELIKQSNFTFIVADVLKIELDPTDLLFIDTLHNYKQLSEELRLHSNKVKKYIILHDTTSFEFYGESYEGKQEEGLWKAVKEFLENSITWKLHNRYTNNNGLTILKRL